MSRISHGADDSAILTTSVDLGPGDGPRVAVKDCLDIQDVVTGCGSRAFADAPPAERHADVVQALLDGGCHIVGKANMHELAFGVTGQNDFTGTPTNPHFPDRIVGGSSSGSAAAVAAGLVDFSIGTDTGGSVRMPAACCGVVGIKPSFGMISRRGAIPAASSLDCIGLFARDMEQIIAAMAIISPDFAPSEAEPRENAQKSLHFARVQVQADDAVDEAVDTALAQSGASLSQVELPQFEAAYAAGVTLIAAEMSAELGHLVGSGKLGADIDVRLGNAANITADQVAEAETVRAAFSAEVDAALENCDALVLPTLPSEPILLSEAGNPAAAVALTRLVRPFNVSGHPAITIPVLTGNGLPAGIQLVGRKGADARLCSLARALEKQLRSSPAPGIGPGAHGQG